MKDAVLKQALKYVDSWIQYRDRNYYLPGISVAVLVGKEVVFTKAYGLANEEQEAPLTEKHLFRFASHSKMFTATALFQLKEQGKLKLDDPVSLHLPWLKGQEDSRLGRITIRQLLGHSAGFIRDGRSADYWQLERSFPNKEDLIEEVKKSGIVLDANSSFKYSNFGYGLLGLVVETVSGTSYSEYVQEHIFDRLGLLDCGFEIPTQVRGRLATAYSHKEFDNKRIPLNDVETGALASATGLYGTPEQLCRFGAAHFIGDQSLVSDDSKREMQHAAWKADEEGAEYGLGFEIGHLGGRKLFGHGGGFPGHSSETLIDADSKMVVSVAVNCLGGLVGELSHGIMSILHYFKDHGDEKPEQDIERFEGRFHSLWGITDIVAVGNQILSVAPGAGQPFNSPDKLTYVNEKNLTIEKTDGWHSLGENVEFSFSQAGEIEKVVYAGFTLLPEEAFYKKHGSHL